MLIAALILSAASSAPASAAELPEFTVVTSFTGTGGKTTFETSKGSKITCKTSKTEGAATNAKEGTFHIVFEGCEEPAFKLSCAGLSEKSGNITVSGKYRLVRLKSADVGVWLLGEEVHLTCSIVLLRVKGSVLALITPLSSKTSKYELKLKQEKGKQEISEYENDEGKKVGGNILLISTGEGAFEAAGEESVENKLTTVKETEIRIVPPAPKVEQVDFKNNTAVLVDHQLDRTRESPVAIDGVGEKNKVEWQLAAVAANTKNWPVTYVRKTKPKLVAQFAMEKPTEEFIATKLEEEATVTGEATIGGVAFKMETKLTKAELEANKGFFVTKEFEAGTELADKVMYEEAKITWKWKLKETGQPAFEQELGKTGHNLYLLNAAPIRGLYLTLLDLATLGIQAEATKQPPAEAEIIKGVWKEFKTKKTRMRWYNVKEGKLNNGKFLKYWYTVALTTVGDNRGKAVEAKEEEEQTEEELEAKKEEEAACVLGDSAAHVEELLYWTWGECNTWAFAFSYALAGEGITSAVTELGVKYGAGGKCEPYKSCFMLVKNWKFEGAGTSGDLAFPYKGSEIKDQNGVEAQNIVNPVSIFLNHFITEAPKASGKLYDPSYGEGPFEGANALKEYQVNAMAGFCTPSTTYGDTKCEKEPSALRMEKLFYALIL